MVTGLVLGFYFWNHISPFSFPCPHCTLFHPITLLGTSWVFDPCAVLVPVNKKAFAELLQAGGAGSRSSSVWLTWGWDGVPMFA